MKKNKKLFIITGSIIAVLLVIFAGVKLSMKLFADKLESEIFPLKDPINVINSEYERSVVCVDWIFDVNDKRKVVGASDYVFVAEVKKVVGTGYTDVKYYGGLKFDDNPFTRYEVRVIENIKGQLITDRDILLTKYDGVHFFGKRVSAFEGDNLPDEGECYIFICNADENGEINIGSFSYFCNIYLCKADEYTGNENLIEVYRDAVENMDISDRISERYKSKYEV